MLHPRILFESVFKLRRFWARSRGCKHSLIGFVLSAGCASSLAPDFDETSQGDTATTTVTDSNLTSSSSDDTDHSTSSSSSSSTSSTTSSTTTTTTTSSTSSSTTTSTSTSSSSSTVGSCDHDECDTGGPLDWSCSTCTDEVCNFDSSCCTDSWDDTCVALTVDLCNIDCGGADTCEHDVCENGEALVDSCNSCVTIICNYDDYCCSSAWDTSCVEEADAFCDVDCGNTDPDPDPDPVVCEHEECSTGVALDSTCSTCATDVCDADSFCCTDEWDEVCISEADVYCGYMCGACGHDKCSAGSKLNKSCDICVTAVCNADPYCCNVQWDSYCVDEVYSKCGMVCQ